VLTIAVILVCVPDVTLWQKLRSIYEDVLPTFTRWKEKEIPIYIYSSGSIQAQKLLFGCSEKGNLLPYLAGHFDTTIGSKLESSSYRKIFETISAEQSQLPKLRIEEVLFVTDNINEAFAAQQVAMSVVLSVRPGNKDLPSTCPFKKIHSFEQLFEAFDFSK
jgi:2,3-diketo-5-methylthio-1-phosphopentane phosphatase